MFLLLLSSTLILLLQFHQTQPFISSCLQVLTTSSIELFGFFLLNIYCDLGSDGVSSWTTRFGITTPGGTLSKEPNAVEPNGDKIPWGTGKLLGGFGTAGGAAAGNTTTASTTAPVVASSPVVVAAANASSSPAVAATPATASAATTPVVAAAGNSPVPTVAQVAPAASTNAGSMVKPALGLISAVVAGYFAL